jgi:hypothetical protein
MGKEFQDVIYLAITNAKESLKKTSEMKSYFEKNVKNFSVPVKDIVCLDEGTAQRLKTQKTRRG